MSEQNEYSLEKSTKMIGQLYPIILSKNGEVVDGLHRREAVKGWKTVTNKTIDTKEKLLMARMIANKCRRRVTKEETAEWVNELGAIALNEHKIELGKISSWIGDMTGYKEDTIRGYLDSQFKNMEQVAPKTETEGSNPADSNSIEYDKAMSSIGICRKSLMNFNNNFAGVKDEYLSLWMMNDSNYYDFIEKISDAIKRINEFSEKCERLRKEYLESKEKKPSEEKTLL